MNVGKINGIRNTISNRIERVTNWLLNEEAVTERIAHANNEAADKFVKLNFDEFPKGSAEEQLYEARTMLGKIAKDNGVSLEFERDKGIILGTATNKEGKCLFGVDGNINKIHREDKKNVGNIILKNKNGIYTKYPRIITSEDNFLRHLYRIIEDAISDLK